MKEEKAIDSGGRVLSALDQEFDQVPQLTCYSRRPNTSHWHAYVNILNECWLAILIHQVQHVFLRVHWLLEMHLDVYNSTCAGLQTSLPSKL